MQEECDDIAELDRRWQAFQAQNETVSNEEVIRWLQTWGTPSFRRWQDWRRQK
jgi:predicted transcriptional regulator